MDSNAIAGLIYVLLGGGGTVGVSLLFKMVRDHQKGKIEDDGTTIERLNAENKDLVLARRKAEEREEQRRLSEQEWMTQAFTYRMQLVSADPPIRPNDNPHLWSRQTPVIEP